MRDVVKGKTKSSMAAVASSFVTVVKHWGLECMWLERDRQGTKSAAQQERLSKASALHAV